MRRDSFDGQEAWRRVAGDMKLEAWLRQEHSLGESLRVVERLSQAVNEVHDGGDALAALEPARIEVSPDGRCDLSSARRGSPRAGYVAPERGKDEAPSTEADVYAAGAIVWEILAGRPCGSSPAHLAQVRPELPRELADAVMGCLEGSPEWRPKDLTYLAQLAAAHQPSTRRTGEPDPRAPQTTRLGAPFTRAPAARPSRSHRPLFLAATLVLAAAAGSYTWIERRAGTGASTGGGTGSVARPPALFPAPQSTPGVASPRPADVPDTGPVATPRADPSSPPAAGKPEETATALPPASPPNPPGREAVVAKERTVAPTPTPPAVVPTHEPAAPVAPPPSLAPSPAAVEIPAEPPVLATLSPLSAQRPGRVLIDLRGTGLHAGLRARILPLREVPRGILVVRQKCVDPTLVTVLIELDAEVRPGPYAITLEDAGGRQAKPLTFTVTR